VGLGSVELPLAQLLDLQPGDVICLPTRLAEAVPIMLDGQPVAQGSLGHCGRHKAVQLVSL
jgi:flagellar motor switch/type III secretory pathway protein FliN